MLMYLELRDVGRVEETRNAALKQLDNSVALYEKVAELAPNQRIVIRPTEDQQASIQAFYARLQERKLAKPTTERELAKLAVTSVREHAEVLRGSKFIATKGDYERLRKVLQSQSLLLDLGILTSIAWTVASRTQ
jgi:hypothetical protein